MAIEKGKLVRWIDDKGFGFIKPENGKADIFIHISALARMNRKPIIGDVILYQIGFDTNGKPRAVNAKIEGMSEILALVPLEQKRKKDLPSPAKERTYRKPRKTSISQKSFNLLPVLIVIGVAVFVYSKVSKEQNFVDQINIPAPETQPIEQTEQTEQFQCQGKVWCSEMTSYEEAMFYLHNCPGTKIDGDGDGDPCEQQFR
jgi:cold shock CspA family protein